MRFIADLHIHSRYSRATSQELDFPALHRSALEKGVTVLGTGDFTHPAWRKLIREQLVPAEPGLFRLEPSLARKAEEGLPAACRGGQVRFLLETEISNIYKRDGRVRKNHNLVFLPHLEAADALSERLAAIGNITSDGRPILGLDARDLLETVLETHEEGFLIPAHIWTPWFSMLGSMSGFDTLDDCFRDLSPHVFAAETGLSSDPSMNWRVSFLDRITLVSNSDAHSPAKVAREANLFDTELSYAAIHRALRTREGFLGTLEFFPEEGKYHLDGHRKCEQRLEPGETRALGGRCPTCGGKLTVGVMSRVLELSDREPGACPQGSRPFQSLVGLEQVVGEALGAGTQSQRVRTATRKLLDELGPELPVLREAPLEDVERVGGSLLREAVRRVRAAQLSISPGYDGEFGTVKIFTPEERAQTAGQTMIAGMAAKGRAKRERTTAARKPPRAGKQGPAVLALECSNDPLAGLDDAQRAAATAESGPLLIVAGPGSGKTRTLVARIAWLVARGEVRPEDVLAITFTRQAAAELRERLAYTLPPEVARRITATTFHAFALRLLQERASAVREVIGEEERVAVAMHSLGEHPTVQKAGRLLDQISSAKQSLDPARAIAEEAREGFSRYEERLAELRKWDLDDLVLQALEVMREEQAAPRWRCVCVDEYQDVNDVQAELVRRLSPDGRSLCCIGDPDQAIYGFRGSSPRHFLDFGKSYRDCRVVRLETSYRLTHPVLKAARSVLGRSGGLSAVRDGPKVELVQCATTKAEAEQLLVRLERIVGGTSHFAVDTGRARSAEYDDVGFGDVAVLVRTKAQRAEILEALGRSGVPCHVVGEDEPHDPRSQKVALMTMHASKGREFAVVFVPGVEPGLMPLQAPGIECSEQEERRLLYVAMTRARRLVVLSHSEHRVMFGRALPGGPSTFLSKVPRDCVDAVKAALPRTPGGGQLSLF